ncbi:hypothetical protein [Mucilaginibacter sp.]|jgi:hypothetical protein|uniref:hypothetical protein n=1 Tax=Mucilaginibacter sp. TaxID=1882438 RepID=UPI003561475F
MLSSNDKIDKGTLKLQSFSRPPLTAGTYTVNAGMEVNSTGEQKVPANFNNIGLSFTITAPRFSLETALIHSVFPLAGSKGAYEAAMPHIILNRKTLPWECAVTNKDGDCRPWLYVLLLNEQELTKDAVKEIKLKEVMNPTAGVSLPDIKLTDEEKLKDDKIKVLEIPAALFKSIAPLKDELDYLAHTRQVDATDRYNKDKEQKKDNNAGWLSVLAGNRLPTVGDLNTAFLVSLEGYGSFIDNTRTIATGNVRLVVMKQWAFKVQGASFSNLLDQLNGNAQDFKMEIKNPADKPLSTGIINAVKFGYTMVNHGRRDGKQAASWYRGPLVPVKISVPAVHAYKSADNALRLDKDTAAFDISYAAAWQLGRFLALENPGFFGGISNWKNTFKQEKPISIARDLITKPRIVDREELPPIINLQDLEPTIKEIESDEVLTDYVIELWNRSKK